MNIKDVVDDGSPADGGLNVLSQHFIDGLSNHQKFRLPDYPSFINVIESENPIYFIIDRSSCDD